MQNHTRILNMVAKSGIVGLIAGLAVVLIAISVMGNSASENQGSSSDIVEHDLESNMTKLLDF